MDFLSLPDEMIAGVMKYREFTYVFQLRRVNTRINCVAKKFKLGTKVPVREMEISVVRNESSGLTFCQLGLQLREDVIQYFNFERREDDFYYYFVDANADLSILEELLNNIESPRKLSLIKFPHQINRNFIQLFQKYRKSFRHCAQLTITEVDFVCSKEECKQFFLFFPELQSLYLSSRRGADIYCDSEVLKHLPLTHIDIWLGPMYREPRQDVILEGMNDTFLFEIVKKCTVVLLSIGFYPETRLMVGGILSLIEGKLAEGQLPANLIWRLPYFHLGNLSLEEACRRIQNFPNSECIFLENPNEEENFTYYCCEIHFPGSQSYIEFNIITEIGYARRVPNFYIS